ncbi:transcriptional regulator, XRE family [Catenulispora acidiphila DSM 44928]|uniref:Transcriptional regulator, XRE family n=1 Tax=Catenulispora acidiphila (strain DSM 44928 / JCM 14897 / NBRC 102108 / NRRL B-24433 / ID139908) TaxID=479433 RepID=C7PYH2_CATAD|nr:peptidoglycan-binding protein [Catenulispora acidiphila]ACU75462.1 transcriptional regulator, XRE family [Catenulispora acidiphila DSM 44928]
MQLRKLKDDSGLSLSRLAAKTGFSVSSWERYLAGKTLPTAAAVEALAELVGADPVRIEALRDAAAQVWTEQAEQTEQIESDKTGLVEQPSDTLEPDDEPGPPAGSSRSRRLLRTAATGAAGAVVGAAVTLLLVGPRSGGTKPQALAVTPRVTYTCTYTQRGGQWYAGNSATTTDFLQVDMWGAEVAELQCLLQRAGFSPGGIDGNFGPLTELAVIKAQKADQLDVDGQVGPKTWAALRA